MNITEKVTSFEDACKMHAPTPEQQKVLDSGYEPATADVKLEIIAKALNTDPETGKVWTPNWDDPTEEKWEAVFNMRNGFSFLDSFGYYSFSTVSSRHTLMTQELCDYFGEQFLAIHKAHKTIQ